MSETVVKSFWQRPEGKMGMLMLIPVIGLLVWAGVTLLPFVLLALQNTIYTMILGFITLVLGVILFDPRFWSRLGALYVIAMRWFTNFIVELDPIAIIKGHLKTLKESLVKMDGELNSLKGEEVKLQREINQNSAEIKQSLSRAQFAEQKIQNVDQTSLEYIDLKGTIRLDGGHAARLDSSNKRLGEVLTKIIGLRKNLERVKAQADYVLKDMTLEVKVREKEFKAVNAGHKAFKQAMNILQGNSLGKELYDESMEFMAADLGNKIGEIERYMEGSRSAMLAMDLNDEIEFEKGMKLLDEWNKKGDQLVLTSPKEKVHKLGTPYTPQAIPEAVVVNSSSKSKYY